MELTKHVKERYAERIAGRDTTIDINTYVAQNEDKIKSGVSKLIEHSEVFFKGVATPGKQPVTMRVSGTWVIVMDEDDEVVVALYKDDFGLDDEELNKRYVSKCLEKLREHLAELEALKAKIKEEIEGYSAAIEENVKTIAEYESAIKKLNNLNKAYRDVIVNREAECRKLEDKIRQDLARLTSKRREF